ncbi:hydroxypyruvate isomerase family protein [Amycolatopsis aidingensis]|uniref:hydroxypyruvate isomerase family protein n=1 Tax=Amycolatopsis aidingensis TaxID=2842453 RepID=UPI001C0C4B88|nr:TIM barrel protein [Amycolatopsis aidingensis]
MSEPGHDLRYDVNLSILFTELPLLRRPAAAKALGFDAVEFWWPFTQAAPGDKEVTEFARAVNDAGVALAGLNFFAGDMAGGDRGLLSWTGRESEFADSVDIAIGLGDQLGCLCFNALYGNRIEDVSESTQDELALVNLDRAATAAARIGARVVLEPLSGAPRYPLRTVSDALAVVDKAGRDNVFLLADLYHLAVNSEDLDALATEHTPRIGHVQIADVPGRNEPGTGSLDLHGHLAALDGAGYRGFVGLEYKPSGASSESFGWLAHERRGL